MNVHLLTAGSGVGCAGIAGAGGGIIGLAAVVSATRLSGINVDNWKVAVYTLSGFFVGMSGIMYAAAYTTITQAVQGLSWSSSFLSSSSKLCW